MLAPDVDTAMQFFPTRKKDGKTIFDLGELRSMMGKYTLVGKYHGSNHYIDIHRTAMIKGISEHLLFVKDLDHAIDIGPLGGTESRRALEKRKALPKKTAKQLAQAHAFKEIYGRDIDDDIHDILDTAFSDDGSADTEDLDIKHSDPDHGADIDFMNDSPVLPSFVSRQPAAERPHHDAMTTPLMESPEEEMDEIDSDDAPLSLLKSPLSMLKSPEPEPLDQECHVVCSVCGELRPVHAAIFPIYEDGTVRFSCSNVGSTCALPNDS